MSHWDQFPGESRSPEGTWEKLSQVAINGAEHDSRERQPHPKCLEGTRVDLLNYIHGLLANKEKGRLIWLHGTAGVGKSAVAFTVAERMRDLKVTKRTNVDSEERLAGTFFFSRKHTERCTTGRFFATLAYQLARNFPSVREDLNKAIRDNPALLDPNNSLRAQMEGLFLIPLRRLQLRLRGCQPSVFVVDALDECMSKTEVADLISLLGRALREPDLPVIHILLTSRSEDHIREAIQEGDVRPLVWEIPVKTTGEGVAAIISLDGADVDQDIFAFLEYSFRKLRGRCSDFPQPTTGELARLASRAGRRFIVASTMMKFIDDGYHDPRDRLKLMLDFTSELLPGTEVYKLYDRILATCTNPARAYLHLSVVAALADPLPIRQISELLGPGEGKDVETALVQLRSVMDIPTDNSLPVNISHSSVRDYVSDSSHCSLPDVQHIRHPHSLLAHSSFHLMMQDIPASTALLDALSGLKKQSRAMKSHNPKSLQRSLAFIVEPPTPLTVLTALQWLRGDHRSDLLPWLETLDGRAWSETQIGRDWLQMEWVESRIRGDRTAKTWKNFWQSQTALFTLQLSGKGWLQTENAGGWLKTQSGRDWLQTESGRDWLQTENAGDWMKTQGGEDWLQTQDGRDWLQIQDGRDWLPPQSRRQWLQTQRGQDWMKTQPGRDWLQSRRGREWLKTHSGREWLQIESGKDWLHTPHGQAWQSTAAACVWVTMEEFLSTWKAVSNSMIVSESFLRPAFQVIQQFKSLPDFLMFPAFLALRHQDSSSSASPQCRFLPDMEIFHAMMAFEDFAHEAQERSRLASDALNYACQNWAFHLSRAPNPRGDTLNHMFISFCSRHLLSWLERQWCLKGLRPCLAILSEGQQARHQSRRHQSKFSLFFPRWSGTPRD